LSRPSLKNTERSRGAAIVIFITLVLLAFTTLLVSQVSVNQKKSTRMQNSSKSLDAANSAILGYALAQPIPGTLPCPDSTGDGIANSNAGGCVTQLGLLPYFTLGLDKLTDSSGANLWYAVEPDYTGNAPGQRNSSTISSLTLNGLAVSHVILAPGPPLDGQNRLPLSQADFLEGTNSDGDLDTYDNVVSATRNDLVLGSPLGSFWSLIERRVLAEAATLTNNYRAVCNQYPWAANFGGPYNSIDTQQAGSLPVSSALPFDWGTPCPMGTAPTPAAWIVNHWRDQLYYRMCTTVEGNCLTVLGSASSPSAVILLAPGSRLSGQTRPTAIVSDYFEAENVSLPADEFRFENPINHSGSYNDSSSPLP